MKWYSGTSQIAWACRALIEGKEINHANEYEEARGWRLAAIIHNLRTRYKWPISTRYDENKVAHYRLGVANLKKLEKPRTFKKEWEAAATVSHPKMSESCKNQPDKH